MSAKNPKTESAHTILRKRDGTHVVVRGEGSVTCIYPRDNFVVEPDRVRVVLEDSIAGVAPDVLEFREASSAVGEYAWSTRLRLLRDALEQ